MPPNIEILQSTFEHININPLFDEPPLLNGNKALPKYLKRTLRLDFSHMMQQQEISNDVSTIGMTSIPSFDLTPPSAHLLLTLPNTTTSTDMGPPMNTLSETSNIVANTPMVPQKKSVIDITPIP
jgi:hypothetical protein